MGTVPLPEPEATRYEQITERLGRAVAVTVTGNPHSSAVRFGLLIIAIAVCLGLAPSNPPFAVLGLVALLLLALEGKK